jgi:hypothetical protein
MKNSLKYLLVAAAAAVSFTGCTLWHEERVEYIPLPGTEIPLDPEPWNPEGGGETVAGD